VQDDYLDAFGDPVKFGKQVGGDIVSDKKTFLLIKTLEIATEAQYRQIKALKTADAPTKVEGMLQIFRDCGVDAWARELKGLYMEAAYQHLEDIAVLSRRKEPLRQLADFLVQREY
jgi:geranylgeranyl diphosphate synthase type II